MASEGCKLSVVVPGLDGRVPESLLAQVRDRDDVEVVSIVGVRPVGRARNEGLRRARGAYVAWVDADDEVAEDWLSEIMSALRDGPDALIFDAKNDGWRCMGDLVYGKADADDAVRDVYENERLQGHLWRTVTRRELWDGLAFDETVCAMEDFLILPNVLMRAKRVKYVPKMLYRYVCNEGSAISKVNMCRIEDAIRAAIVRWKSAPACYRDAALKGSMALAYGTLLTLKVDPAFRRAGGHPDVRAGERFLRQHCFATRTTWHERMRFVCAGLGFWLPQRLAYWLHFG